tara:strand:- start:822 stop:1445 length:624 start_codon:yes stop_codon:yes gene_type:complete
MIQSDVFVILDDCQYEKNGFQNRNKILTPHGIKWLTIPVKFDSHTIIKNVKIVNNLWQKKHRKTIFYSYSNTSYFDVFFPLIEEIFLLESEYLINYSLLNLDVILNIFYLKCKIYYSSSMNINTQKTQRLVDICNYVGADTYLSGIGAKTYIDEDIFLRNDIKLIYQEFDHPIYNQIHTTTFKNNLSFIDLLFNAGHNAIHNDSVSK